MREKGGERGRRERRGRGEGKEREGRNAIVWTNTKVLCRLSIPEEVLGPHNAVNGFTGRVAYGTARERLVIELALADIHNTHTLQRRTLDRGSACEVNMVNDHLAYDGHLPKVASTATFNEGHTRSQEQMVDMVSGN